MDLLSTYYHKVFVYPDIGHIDRLLSQVKGPLIDLGCATGRVLEIADRQGVEAIGIDNDADMVRVGEARLSGRSNIRFIESDFLTPQPELIAKAGLVTIVANTFMMLLDQNDRIRLLRNVRSYLNQNGRSFIYVRGDSLSEQKGRAATVDINGQPLEFKIRWDEDTSAMIRTFELFFSLNGSEQRYEFATKMVPFTSLIKEFSEAGLEVEEVYGDFTETPLTKNSVNWFFVLKSKGLTV